MKPSVFGAGQFVGFIHQCRPYLHMYEMIHILNCELMRMTDMVIAVTYQIKINIKSKLIKLLHMMPLHSEAPEKISFIKVEWF